MLLIEVVVILVLVIVNGLLAMAELSVTSAREAKLLVLLKNGKDKAGQILGLLENPTDFLSTIQLGMTIISVLAGVFGGATLSNNLDIWLQNFEVLSPYSTSIALVTTVLIITYLSVVVGELVPKRVALSYPEEIAIFLVPPILSLSRFLGPVVGVLTRSTEVLLKFAHIEEVDEQSVTEEEIKAVVSQGAETGAIEKEEEQIVHKALRLGDRPVSSFMTPRPDIVWLDLAESIEVNWEKACDTPHTHFPLGYERLDELKGIVTLNDFARIKNQSEKVDLESILRQPLRVQGTISGLDLLRLLRQHRTAFAIVIDEHGGVDGVVTILDLMESLVGELDPEGGVPAIRQLADGSISVDAWVNVRDIFETLGMVEISEWDTPDYSSLGGFLLSKLGTLPREGDILRCYGFSFEIVDMDGHRIDKVIIRPDLEQCS